MTEDEKKQNCESIIGYEDGKYGKCSYNSITYYGCNFESFRGCESYTGDSEYICNKVYAGSYAKYVMKDKKCTSEPIPITSCEIYVGQVGNDKVTKEGCVNQSKMLLNMKNVFMTLKLKHVILKLFLVLIIKEKIFQYVENIVLVVVMNVVL